MADKGFKGLISRLLKCICAGVEEKNLKNTDSTLPLFNRNKIE